VGSEIEEKTQPLQVEAALRVEAPDDSKIHEERGYEERSEIILTRQKLLVRLLS